MIVLHDVYTAYLSGLTTKLNEKEIWWKTPYGLSVTVELVNVRWEKYIVRRYWSNGNVCWERNYYKDKQHGSDKSYYENGSIWLDANWCKNRLNGWISEYCSDGTLIYKQNYKHGKLL